MDRKGQGRQLDVSNQSNQSSDNEHISDICQITPDLIADVTGVEKISFSKITVLGKILTLRSYEQEG